MYFSFSCTGLLFDLRALVRFFCSFSCTTCFVYKTEFCFSSRLVNKATKPGSGTVRYLYLHGRKGVKNSQWRNAVFFLFCHFIILLSKSSIILQLFSARWLWQQDLRDRARAYSSLSTGKAAAPSSPQYITSYTRFFILSIPD
jgi:hypothetical protein